MPTDDLRILALHELSSPADVIGEIPRSSRAASTVAGARTAIHRILTGADDRLAVVIGPCSVHDPDAALEYAHRLEGLRGRLKHVQTTSKPPPAGRAELMVYRACDLQ